MASQQAFQFHAQNKGTLAPGQLVNVNKYSVRVERYLAQGGFAHVYLVRTDTPVYNTTHHVLKRIPTSSDAMLGEVKKEVDIMKQLKGHPNIVHLIDSAWHRMPNGFCEVFILMEYCPGGGIIDMMNRRLRERLTEAEILQIFVDVCEGLAAMHNMRPPLIHRDLKVENILQSSPTSYKLCDFGSASTVAPRPPANTQEIRALEADLNRHTTLQYRAPEMVDLYSRRPVDEKSDVWALGVLLYKLCYYTTPFEEHGPLAILNVSYRTPPYPVYSGQMNALIASMLREHGTQRPSVFEVLSTVHGLRGTTSPFQYKIPSPQPLSHRHLQSQSRFQAQVKPSSALQRQQGPTTPSLPTSAPITTVNAGVQARDKVLEAIAPMRRGRPSASSDLRSSSPQGTPDANKKDAEITTSANWSYGGGNFNAEEDKAWKAVVSKSDAGFNGKGDLDQSRNAWIVKEPDNKAKGAELNRRGSDFANQLWDSFDPSSTLASVGSNTPKVADKPRRLSQSTGGRPSSKVTPVAKVKPRDAFESLNLNLEERTRPPLTLGEARKLRTGLAAIGTVAPNGLSQGNDQSSTSARPMPSPKPAYLSPPGAHAHSKSVSSVSNAPGTTPPVAFRHTSGLQLEGLSPEARFPSVEMLDASFAAGSFGPASSPPQIQIHEKRPQPPAQPLRTEIHSAGTGSLRPTAQPQFSRTQDGVRSQQVTGVAMRDANLNKRTEDPSDGTSRAARGETVRPILMRKHRSSLAIKPKPVIEPTGSKLDLGSNYQPSFGGVPNIQSSAPVEPKDWLTGADNDVVSSALTDSLLSFSVETPILRNSPGKRTSVIEKSTMSIPLPQEAVSFSYGDRLLPPTRRLSPSSSSPASSDKSASHSRFQVGPSASATRSELPGPVSQGRKSDSSKEIDSSSDEGPESADGHGPFAAKAKEIRREEQRKERTGKGRQSSVHDLVDLWGGAAGPGSSTSTSKVEPTTPTRKRQSKATLSSSLTQPIPSSTSQSVLSPPADSRASDRSSKQPSPTPARHGKQPSTAGSTQSPVSGRSRPQSMFLFPVSKASSEGDPLSAGLPAESTSSDLLPPDDSIPRTRRTSISNMVQHYEAIGSKNKPRSPPIASKPPAFKTGIRQADGNRSSKGQHGSTSSFSKKNENANAPAGTRVSTPSRSSIGVPGHKKTPTLPDARTIIPNALRTSPVGMPDLERPKRTESPVPQSKTPPLKRPSVSELPLSDPRTRKFPSRKSTLSEESTKVDDGRSASPEQPYQGVGKLIDQWQRKTAEAEAPRSPVKSRPGPKRVGTANRGS